MLRNRPGLMGEDDLHPYHDPFQKSRSHPWYYAAESALKHPYLLHFRMLDVMYVLCCGIGFFVGILLDFTNYYAAESALSIRIMLHFRILDVMYVICCGIAFFITIFLDFTNDYAAESALSTRGTSRYGVPPSLVIS